MNRWSVVLLCSLLTFSLLVVRSGALLAQEKARAKPNIIYILCDDLGYGDVRCLNPAGKIATPHFDSLAKDGMIFTDAHGGSAVCTPTRYGVMTGRYAWRTKLQRGVLGGLSPSLIAADRLTVARLLKEHGYRTACVGKWHLGLDWVKQPGKEVNELSIETAQQVNNVDYAQPFAGGPRGAGFDEYFGISASLDMVPYTFLRDDRVAILPTAEKSFPMMLGRTGGQTRKGPAAPDFEAEDVLPSLTREAIAFVTRQAAAAREGKPFFLYLPLASPHTPIVPTKAWQEKSELNPYADFVMQTDAAVGELLKTLDDLKLTDNTLVIFTSDNGCSPQAKFDELKAKGHNPSHVFRGTKADIFDGGHRVPFIVRWPKVVSPGTKSDQLTCLTDLLATAADIVQVKLPATAGEDSVSMVPAFTGQAKPIREAVVHHSINGSFAIRRGSFKLAITPDSGGWSEPRPANTQAAKQAAKKKAKQADDGTEASLPPVQLYDLSSDIGEQTNLATSKPHVVGELVNLLNRYLVTGRSTPGPSQPNDVPVARVKARE